MPSALKRALAREVGAPRRQPERPRDGNPGRALRRPVRRPRAAAARSPATSGVALLRMPDALKDAIDAEAARTGSHANDVILHVLADELAIPFSRTDGKEPMASTNGKTNGTGALRGQGPRRDHRRRQLRQLAPPGRRVLQGRRSGHLRPRASCTSTSAATTSATSSSPPRSTSRRTRSARISPTRSGRTRTTRTSSPTSRRPASRSRAA